MPQFPWYHDPANAEHMSLDHVFLELYEQASRTKHPLACRMTQSMTDSKACLEPGKAWLSSEQQPESACLGDFLKLQGHRLSAETPSGVNLVHFTTVVEVMEIVYE